MRRPVTAALAVTGLFAVVMTVFALWALPNGNVPHAGMLRIAVELTAGLLLRVRQHHPRWLPHLAPPVVVGVVAAVLLVPALYIARRELGWTAAECAERLGVNAEPVSRIDKGAPTTAIRTVLEAAVLCGVPLFGVDPTDLRDLAERQRTRLALLPQRVRAESTQVSSDV